MASFPSWRAPAHTTTEPPPPPPPPTSRVCCAGLVEKTPLSLGCSCPAHTGACVQVPMMAALPTVVGVLERHSDGSDPLLAERGLFCIMKLTISYNNVSLYGLHYARGVCVSVCLCVCVQLCVRGRGAVVALRGKPEVYVVGPAPRWCPPPPLPFTPVVIE
jgi:hypothetical protein